MANELTVSVKFTWTKNSTTVTLNREGVSVTTSGDQCIHHRQTIGTSEELLAFGDVVAGGYCVGVNRDPTNFVKLRAASGAADLVKAKPGEPFLFRFNSGITPYAIADTAPCDLEYAIVED
jgi:hypothetical protein